MMKKLDVVRLTIGQLEEVRPVLGAARSDLVHQNEGFDPSGMGWGTPLFLERAAKLLLEASQRLSALYEGSPSVRYGKYKLGDDQVRPWKDTT